MLEPLLEHGGELKTDENFSSKNQHPTLIQSILNLVFEVRHSRER